MSDIKVTHPGGTLTLRAEGGEGFVWTSQGQGEGAALLVAQSVTASYRYSTAHGQPGHLLARRVAEALGGRADLPPVKDNPGVDY